MATRSAASRRAENKQQFQAFLADCPSRDVLGTISNKWVTLVLAALEDRSLRYNEIRDRIAGVSPKMLTQTLRSLERDGMITRTVTPSVPIRVDYELTALGCSLLGAVLALKSWSETHIAEIESARNRSAARDVGGAGADVPAMARH